MSNIEFFEKCLNDYFCEYKNKLRINKSFNIKFKIKHEKDVYAKVEYIFKDKEFIVKINDEKNKTLCSLKDSIIHEFFHILFSPLSNKIDVLLKKIKNQEHVDLEKFKTLFNNEEERLVRKLTKIAINLEKHK